MKVPEDRNPCLTFVAAEKKPASRFTKKGEVLEDTHEIPQRGSRVQRCCSASHVAQVKVPEDRNPCLTFVAAEKKPALRFTKKGEVFKSTHEIAVEAIQSRPSPSRVETSLRSELFLNVRIIRATTVYRAIPLYCTSSRAYRLLKEKRACN